MDEYEVVFEAELGEDVEVFIARVVDVGCTLTYRLPEPGPHGTGLEGVIHGPIDVINSLDREFDFGGNAPHYRVSA